VSELVRILLLALIRGYQLAVSPVIGPACRFHPTCSHYAVEAIERHGAWRGGVLAVRRVLRCHPFRAGGYDPVPTEKRVGS
jgi:putative membrane protein insertion efficiency factor